MEENKVRTKMDEIWRLLNTDPDFVCLPRYGGSLKRVLERYPEGVPEAMAAEALQISVEEYRRLASSIMEKLRTDL